MDLRKREELTSSLFSTSVCAHCPIGLSLVFIFNFLHPGPVVDMTSEIPYEKLNGLNVSTISRTHLELVNQSY